ITSLVIVVDDVFLWGEVVMPGSSGTNARVIAYNAVVQWLGPHVNLPPSQIKVDRKFAGKPPGGYGQITGAYMTM
ncbi:MAG: hypothetical protein MUO41_03050, partial [Methyloceanibacter sp.]|nr:hypothetical protein [Methyloceanibacter sp.]